MKACVLHNINDLRYEDVPDPVPQRGEVLLDIKASGICGSDIGRVFHKGTYHFPTIPGHEFAGEVAAVGDGVSPSLTGTRAAVFPMIPCMECRCCSVGEYAQCGNYDYYGSRRDGGFARYLAVKEENLVFIPESLSFEEAAMCEPTAVAIHALSQAGIEYGDTVAVYGAGTIGLIIGKIARDRGASKIILIDIDRRKLDFARSLGFEYLINSTLTDAPGEINTITDARGADVTVEGTGVSAGLENCLKSAAVFGRVVLMGNPAGDMHISQKAYWEILRRQLTLRGTWNSSFNGMKNDWKTAVEAMPRLGVGALITHRFDLSRCGDAFALMKDPDTFKVKVMFAAT
ncbi:MAG: galactitol-1-phosphate 5-dehydrogenase [Eubacteriales bacterium]|nr:galactitol-1-phosphate 5-dehydrogenase [Eubacteriales bacterium]